MKISMALAFLLTACGTTGGVYSSVDVPKITKNTAQIVVYHPSGEFTGSIGGNPDVKINGQVVCSLPNSTFFVKSVKPGSVSISSTKTLSVGTSYLNLNASPNKRYYVRITWNEGKVFTGAVFGLIGSAVAEGTSVHSGPFVIDSVSEQIARGELSDLKESICSD